MRAAVQTRQAAQAAQVVRAAQAVVQAAALQLTVQVGVLVRQAVQAVVLLHIMQLRAVLVQPLQIMHVNLSEGRMYGVVQV